MKESPEKALSEDKIYYKKRFMTIKNTLNIQEVEKFSKLSSQWWDPTGSFKTLLALNPIRLAYIKTMVEEHFGSTQFNNISVLDIGCGGGLVSEPLAKIGFKVTGIDASDENVKAASSHAAENKVKVNYFAKTAEELANEKVKFDVVLALEIIEHVDNVEYFVESISQLVNKNGLVIVSTLSKTAKSFLTAILGAEYIMRLVPIGTHEYEKFLKPSAIVEMAEDKGLKVLDMKGLKLNPFTNIWKLSDNLDVNYLISFACHH